MAATRHKIVAMVVEIAMLRGSLSHVNNIEPTRANKKPRKERKTQRERHRANSSVGGDPWKSPTCSNRGLVDHIALSPESGECILTGRRTESFA